MKNIFAESGKRHLLVTGSRNIGKSTLLRAAFSNVEHRIISTAVIGSEPHPEQINLFCSGMTGSSVIGLYENGRMNPLPEGFIPAISAINELTENRIETVLIDEIGFIENSSPAYQYALKKLFDSCQVIASVRKASTAFIDSLTSREDVHLIDLDEWYGRRIKVGCVVMASGFSTRFASNKLLAEYTGKPLAAHLFEKLKDLPDLEVIVVTRYPEVSEIAAHYGLKALLHNEPALSDTIRLGVSALPAMDGYMLCVADQPLLTAATIRSLAEAFRLEPERIHRLKCGDTPGNPVIFPAKFRNELCALTGENGGRAVIKAHPEALRFFSIEDPMELMDIDTAENLNNIKKDSR